MSLKSHIKSMRADIRAACKSGETESWWDRVFTAPLGYLWARLFIRAGWTPNMVTKLSMVMGFAGGCLFVSGNLALNIAGVLLMVTANIFDSTDGQMARLTGVTTTEGRILDALSAYTGQIAVYGALCVRLFHRNIPFSGSEWGGLIWVIALITALFAHLPQCSMADYYRNIHLFFLKNSNTDGHDCSKDILARRAALPKNSVFRGLYLTVYALRTRQQEKVTPDTQKLFRAFETAGISDEVRGEYLDRSRRHIQLTNMLTYNVRALILFVCAVFDVPFIWFLCVLGMDALLVIMILRYEKIARDLLYTYKLPGSETPYKKPNFWPVLFFVLGLGGVISTLAGTDLSGVDWKGDVLGRMGVWLPSILGVWLLIYILHTVAYAVIIGSDSKKINPLHLFRMVISGFALNNVTPVGFAGGEPYRIMELKGSIGVEKATASAFNFTIMNTVSNLGLWFGGALMYMLTGFKGGFWPAIPALIVLGVMGWLGLLFVKSKGDSFVGGALAALAKLPLVGKRVRKLLDDKRESIGSIDREMGAFRARRRDFIITLTIELATRLLEVAEIYILLRVLGAQTGYLFTMFSLATASLIGNLIFFIPMQMGAREAGFAVSLGWGGVASSVSVTASLLTRIREIFYLMIGVGLMLMKSKEKEAQTEEQAD